ncbi:MAG: response regulator transcription factor [Acidimicrobiia bacterium]|nr:response regulator transcription factor [Acidimicrobiia bacterium]
MVNVSGGPATASRQVLVVEDDPTVSEVVVRYLERDGYVVRAVGDGTAALEEAAEHPPDLVILDLMLPGLDGLEVCRRLRQEARVPVVMLTARGEEEDRLAGLEHGADDYVTKPFSPRELMARVRAVLRRTYAPAPGSTKEPLIREGLTIDRNARTVELDGTAVHLTAREFDLLAFLASNPGTAFPREELLEQVWGYSYGDASTVTVHIRRLREKIEEAPSAPRRIVTVWGVGYRFTT